MHDLPTLGKLRLLLHAIRILVGVTCLMIAWSLYPNEEGKIQSVLEDLWVKIDDRNKRALSLHTAFMQEVAKATGGYFDLLFGHRLLSIRSLASSLCLSLASFAIFMMFIEYRLAARIHQPVNYLGIVEYSILCAVSVLVALLYPRSSRSQLVVWIIALVIVIAIVFIGIEISSGGYLLSFAAIFPAALTTVIVLFAAFACDVSFIVLTRQLLRWASDSDNFLKILTLVIANCSLAILLIVVGPIWWVVNKEVVHTSGLNIKQEIVNDMLLISMSNTIDGLMASAFVIMAALLLIHRIFWPLLNRSIFRIQDIGFMGRRALLFCVGLGLLTIGAVIPEWLKEFLAFFKE